MLYTLRFFSVQNAVCFIMLTCLVPVLFTFYIQGVLKLKKNNSGAKGLRYSVTRRPTWGGAPSFSVSAEDRLVAGMAVRSVRNSGNETHPYGPQWQMIQSGDSQWRSITFCLKICAGKWVAVVICGLAETLLTGLQVPYFKFLTGLEGVARGSVCQGWE